MSKNRLGLLLLAGCLFLLAGCTPSGKKKTEEAADSGYRLLLGGRGGRRLLEGRPTQRVFADKEEMLAAVERAIQLYREEGLERERFGELIERLGPAYVEERIAGEI